PTVFEYLNTRGVPAIGIVACVVVGVILLLPFPGWRSLVSFITAAYVISYAAAPLALSALRHQLPDQRRPYRLPAAKLLSPLGFIVANLIVYWTGWDTDWKLFAAIILGFSLLALSGFFKANPKRQKLDWGSAVWLWPYLGGMALISYLGAFPATHHGMIPFGFWDTAVVVVFSLGIYFLALHFRLDPAQTRAYIEQQGVVEEEADRLPVE
ncbi:MAG: APC family permease, partial [Candidatus Dormibacteraceae bacterium]